MTTREKQIEQASHKYSNSLTIGCYLTYEELECAFQAGAEYADNNPLWHKYPDEKPTEKGKYLVCTNWGLITDNVYYIFENAEEYECKEMWCNFSNDVIAWIPLPKPPKF